MPSAGRRIGHGKWSPRGDLYAIADELETVKMMIRRLASRAYLCRTLLLATATIWAPFGVVVVLLIR